LIAISILASARFLKVVRLNGMNGGCQRRPGVKTDMD
jgi:hypothetical protein